MDPKAKIHLFILYHYKTSTTIYRIAQNCGGGKLWRIDRFRAFSEENVGELTVATFSNLEFGWVKYW